MRLATSSFVLSIALFYVGCGPAKEPDKEKGKANRLVKESSPYLLQHAHNPVDWFPWGEEAFAKAKKENKLIFLSIGYSSCHWCHVMERESFSDAEVAKMLNENFVCIKVDREERPDVDEIYMTALQVVGGHGGWPLNMFLMPDAKPIIGGTYWPKDDREVDGKMANGFKSIMKMILDLKKEKAAELQEQANQVAEATSDQLNRAAKGAPLTELELDIVRTGIEAIQEEFDPVHGGIGRKKNDFLGTKFPMPATLAFLYEQTRKDTNRELRILLRLTLDKMATGGIYDQLGGGFHRYSTERTWTIPHFEKMLYDNAQLVELYAMAQETEPQATYVRVIDETLAFIAREMTSPEGGFYSALDADSNGKEGEFYVWTPDEIEKILGNKEDAILFKAVYGSNPNFETKLQILKLARPLAEVAKDQQLTEETLLKRLEPMKTKLLAERAKRERPFLDKKILTAWNGQMIAAYASAGRVLKNPKYIDAAKKAADFVLTNLRTKEGRLQRVYGIGPDGKGAARLNGYLDDYALLIHGLLNLYDATKEARWLDEAKALTATMVKNYGEEKRGGYYFTSHDHEKLFARSKDHYDGAQPSGNGVAARNMVRLFKRTNDKQYRELAKLTLTQFAGVMKNNPNSVPVLLQGLSEFLEAQKSAIDPKTPDAFVSANQGVLSKSDSVVKVTADAGKTVNGEQKVEVTIDIQAPWHVYANPVKSKLLMGAETTITFLSGGKKLTAKIDYPKGKLIEDAAVGDYLTWEGKVIIAAIVQREATDVGPLDITIKLQACDDKRCLLPGTVKLSVK